MGARDALWNKRQHYHFYYFKSLTHAADCFNLVILSEATNRIAICCNLHLFEGRAPDENTVADSEGRPSKFLTKVLIGACGQLWLKLSLFAITYSEVSQNKFEYANMVLG